jgi:hypothetical protein
MMAPLIRAPCSRCSREHVADTMIKAGKRHSHIPISQAESTVCDDAGQMRMVVREGAKSLGPMQYGAGGNFRGSGAILVI